MFKWLSRFLRNKNNCRYISCCSTPISTPSAAPVYCIEPNKFDTYKAGCSTANVCCNNTSCGYRTSPYNKNFVKPTQQCHGYRPINTTFCCNNTCCVEPVPVQPAPTTNYNPPVSTPSACCVDFYETLKTTTPTCCTPVVTPTYEPCASSCVPQTVESSAPAPIIPKEGYIFAMNGYGVEVQVGNENIEAFIDMGIDVNITPGQKVLLHQRQGKYDKMVGLAIKETGNERKGESSEILIQELLNV